MVNTNPVSPASLGWHRRSCARRLVDHVQGWAGRLLLSLLLLVSLGVGRAEAGPNDIYAVGFATNNIYQINPSTGSATLVYTGYPIAPATQNSAAVALRRTDGLLFYIAGTAGNGAVYRWDPATPATAPVFLGRTGAGTPYMPRLIFGSNNVLYAADNAGTQLYTINTTTGVATAIGTTLSGTPTGGGDMALNPADGRLYLTGGITVYAVPVAGGPLLSMGNISGMAGTVVGTAFSSTGQFLVANNANPAQLYTVNFATMAATPFSGTMTTGMGDLASAPLADISLSKTNLTTSIVSGSSTTYTITVSNSGPSGTIRVPVIDSAPGGLTFGTWTCTTSTGSCGAASGTGNLNTFVDLPANATATYSVPATIALTATGSVTNTVTAGDLSGAADLTPTNNTSSDTDAVVRQADLGIGKNDSVASVNALGTTTYAVAVTNAGPSLSDGAIVTDPAVAGLTKTGVTCAATGGAVCPATLTTAALEGSGLVIPTLPPTGTVTFQVSATLTATSGTVTNVAAVAPATGTTDPVPGNNSGLDTDTVTPRADLSVNKSDSVGSVSAGGTTTYAITIANAGPSSADGTLILDAAAAGLSKTTVTCVATNGAVCPATLTVAALEGGGLTIPTLPATGTITLQVGASVTATSGSVANTASVTLPVGVTDPAPGNNASTDTDTVSPAADLVMSKTDSVASVNAGGTTTYAVVVTNNGPSAANGAVVTDPTVAGLSKTAVSCVAAGGAVCPATSTVAALEGAGLTISTLPNGGSVTFSVTATVTATSGSVANIATVAAPVGVTDPAPANNSFTDTDTVNAVADLVMSKSDGVATVNAGGTTVYSVVVTNNGPSAANGAVVTDPAVAGLSKTTVSCVAVGSAVCPATSTVAGLEGAGLTIPTLPNGGSVTFSVTATVTATTGSVANVATVAAPVGVTDPTPGNNSFTDTDTINPLADLVMSKTDGVATINAGGTTVYAVVVTNNGLSAANGAIVTDPAVAGLSKTTVSCVAAGGAVCPATSTVAALEGAGLAIPTLPSGGNVTLSVTATVTATTGTVTNVATVAAPVGVTDPTPGNNSFTDTDTVNPVADLVISKTDGVATVSAGGTTTYAVTVSNSGPSAANGAVVTDPAVAGLSKTAVSCVAAGSAVCPATSTVAGLEGTGLTIPTLPNGGSVTFTVTATVTASSGSVSNTASVTPPASVTDPVSGSNSFTDTDTVNPVANLVMTKTDGVASVNAGGTTTYAATVSNSGPSSANGAVVTDPAVAGLSKTTVSCVAAGGAACPATSTVAGLEGAGLTIPTLPNGGSVTFSVTATVTATSGSVANTASVTLPVGVTDPTPGNNSFTDTDTINPLADLVMSKTDSVASVNAGGTTVYSVVVTNNGPSAANSAVVTDPAIAGLSKTTVSCVAAGGAACPATSTVAGLEGTGLTIPTLPNGGNVTFSVTATVTATTGSVANVATVVAPVGVTDPTPGNNSFTDTDTVNPVADLVMAKTDSVATVNAGGTTTYAVVVTNNGPSAANGAVVTDPAVAGLSKTAVSCVAAGGAACPATSAVAGLEGAGLAIPTLPSGGSVTFSVTATVTATTGSVANVATVSAPVGVTDPTPGNNSFTDTDTVNPVADLVMSKTDSVATVNAGGTTVYSVVVTNNGPSAANGAVVTDPAVAGLSKTAVSCVAAGGAVCPAVVTVATLEGAGLAIPTLPNGGSATFTVGATVTASSGSVSNTANVTPPVSVTDPTPGNNSFTDTDTVNPVADLVMAKSDSVATVNAGGTTVYSVVVTNNGPSAANGAVVTDPAVAGLSKTAVSCVAAGGAACPVTSTVAGLEGAGLTIPTLSNGGSVTFSVTATVTATSGSVANVATVAAPVGVTDPTPGNNSFTDTDTVSPVADLVMAKSDSVATVNAGGTTVYAVVVTNNGPSPANGAVVTDPAVAGLSKTTVSCAAAGGAVCPATSTVAGLQGAGLTIPTLPNGGSVTFSVTATVTATTGSVANTASVTLPVGVTDPTPGNNSFTDTNSVNPVADLVMSKTDSVASVNAGGTTVYSVVVTNSGPSSANGAMVTDPAVAGLSKTTVSCVAAGSAVCPATSTVAGLEGAGLTIPTLPNGGSVTFSVTATVTATTGSVANVATVSAPVGVTDPTPGNNSFTDTDTVSPVADLVMAKSDSVATVNAGGTTTYVLVVSNSGPSAANGAVATDPAAAGLTKTTVSCVAAGGAACPATSTVAALEAAGLTIPTLPNGGSVTFSVTATVTATSGSVANVATVAAPVGVTDPTPGNNSFTDTDTINPLADLVMSKTDSVASVNAGGTTVYSVVVTNSGPSAANGAVVTDPAVAGLSKTIVSCVAAGGAACPATSTVAGLEGAGLTIPTLPNGGSVTFSVTATVTATSGSVANTASVTVPVGVTDPAPGNNTSTDADTVNPVADLVMSKTDSVATVNAGGTTVYAVVVTNNGPSPANGAVVTDPAVAGLSKTTVSCAAAGGAVCPATSTVAGLQGAGLTIPTLPNGGSVTFTVNTTVTASTGSVSNTASVTPPVGVSDPTPGNNSATDTDSVNPIADLAITKADSAASVNAGGATSYTVVVTNNGPSAADGAIVVDAAVAGLSKSALSCVASGGAVCPATMTTAALEGAGLTIPTLPLAGSVTFTITATVTATTGSITNTASAAAPVGVTDSTPGNNAASDTDVVNAVADIAVTKTDSVASVNAGGTTTYALTVTNAGPSAADGTVVADSAVAGLSKTSVSCLAAGGAVCPAVATVAALEGTGLTIPTLPNGGSVTITVTATVTASAGSVSNTVSVAAPVGVTDPTPGNNSATDTDSVSPIADLAITKTDSVAAVNAGATATYAIVVTNNGPSPADGATVVDAATAGLNKTAVSCVAAGGAVCPAVVTVAAFEGTGLAIATLPSGGSVTFTVTAAVTASSGSVSNTASVVAPAGVTDPTPGNNSATDTDSVNAIADLTITKTDGAASVNAGGTTTYMVVVTNNGPSPADGATVVDAATAGLNKTAVACVAAGGAVCPAVVTVAAFEGTGLVIPTLPSGGSVTLTVTTTVTATSGSIANTTSVSAPVGVIDPTPGNNSSTDTDSVNAIADLAVAKSDSTASVNAGGTTTYTVTATNAGPSTGDGAVVVDLAAAGLSKTAVSCVATGGAACPATTTVAALEGAGLTIPTLPNGGSVTFTVSATVTASTGSVANTASVAPPVGVTDPTPGNNSSTDTDSVNAIADLAVAKSDSTASVNAGGATTYTVVVTNNGPSPANGATVVDAATAGLSKTAVSCVAAGGAVCPAVVTVAALEGAGLTIPTLPNGGSVTFTVSAMVTASAGAVANTASVAPPVGVTDPTPVNNSATDTDSVSAIADLAIAKTDGAAGVNAGGTTTYTMTVTNAGPSAADGAVVVDAATVGLNKTAVSCSAAGGAVCPAAVTTAALEGTGLVIPTLPNGGSITFTVTATVTASAGSVSNTAIVNPPVGVTDPTPGNNSATDTDSVGAIADLSITNTDGVTSVTPGGTTTYTVVIANAGPSAANAATATVTAPSGVSFTAWTCAATGGAVCPASGSGNIATSIDVPSGGSLTFTIAAAISGGATGPLATTASVTPPASVTDPNPANNNATDTDNVSLTADLAVTNTDGVPSVTAGGTTTYTVTFSNSGPSATNSAAAVVTAPAGVTFTTWTCTAASGAICPATGSGDIAASLDLPAGSSATFTITAAIGAAAIGPLNAIATITAPGGVTDVNLANNSATDSDTVARVADLAISKTDGTGAVSAAGTTTYTIVVSNSGPSIADGATIADPATAGLVKTAIACAPTGGATCPVTLTVAGLESSGLVIPSLPVGGTLTLQVSASVTASNGTVANTATVTAPAGVSDPQPGNNSATDTDAVNAFADLSVTNTDGVTSLTPGGTTTYTVVIGNAGPSAANAATATVNAPVGLTFASWTCVPSGGAVCPPSGSGNIASAVDLPSGSSVTFTVVASVSGAASGTIVTTASVTPPASVTDVNPANNAASDTDGVGVVTDLAITKSNGGTSLLAGANTAYTIVVSNAGPSNADGATVTDAAVAGLTKTSVSCVAAGGAVCPASLSVATLQAGVAIATLPAGSSLTFTVNATLVATSGSVANTATVTPPVGATDPTPANNTATDTDTVTPVADLAITNTDGVTSLTPGGTTTYTVVVSNAGPSAVNGATASVVAPSGLTFTSWTCVGSGGAVCPASGSGNIAATVDVPSSGSLTFTIVAAVSPSASGTLTTTATVTSPVGITDPNPANNSASDSDGVGIVTDLSITKTNGSTSVNAGGTTVYTVVVQNGGPSAADGSVVTDPSSVGLTKTAVACVAVGGAVCPAGLSVAAFESGITVATLPSGGTLTFTVNANVVATNGAVTNSTTVAPPAGAVDPTPANNSATDTDAVTPVADMSVTITDGVVSLTPGGTTTYAVVVTNAGPSSATNAPFTVTAPAGLSFGGWTCAASGGAICPAAGSGNISTLVTVPAGATLTFSMPAAVAGGASGSLSTVATIVPPAGTVDPNPANNTATDVDSVGSVADLHVTVTDGVASLAPGAPTTYTVVVGNSGPSSVTGATVSVPVPVGLSLGAWSCVASGGAVCPASGTGAIAATVDIPVGSTLTFTLAATVSPTASGSVSLPATVTPPAGTTDPVPANNNAVDVDAVILPTPVADLSVTKTDGVTNVSAGASTTYTIVVANAGPDVATGALVTDAVAAGLTKTTVTCAAAAGASCPATTTVAALEGGITLPTLPVGGTVTFSVTAQVTATTGTVANTVTVTAPAGVIDPTPANNTQTDTDTVSAVSTQADLGVVITDGTATVSNGGVTTYTITVTNAGPAAVTGATLASVAPPALTYGAWTCNASAGSLCPSAGSGNLNALVNLSIGGTVTFTVPATVSPSASGAIVATATVTVPAGVVDGNLANNTATDTDTIAVPSTQADLSITKTNNTATLGPGATTTYTIVVANAGPATATAAIVRDAGNSTVTIGAWTCVAAAGASCVASGTGAIDTPVTLPANGQVTFTVNATVAANASGAVSNTATVTAPAGLTDPNTSNNTATDSDNIPPQRIGVAKEAGEPQYVAPLTFEVPYTIRVENTGSIPATNVQVSDSLAEAFAAGRPVVTLLATPTVTGIKGASAAQCVGNGSFNGNASTTLLTGTSTLAPGQACEIAFRVRLAYPDQPSVPTTPQLNQAQAATYQSPGTGVLAEDESDSGKEPATSNPGAPGDTGTSGDPTPVVFAIPRLDITKAVTRVEQVDDTTFDLRYLLRVKNTGPVPARNVQVTDDLAAAFSDGSPVISVQAASPVISLAAGPSLEDGDASLTLATGTATFNGVTQTAFLTGDDVMPPGQSRTIAFTVRLRYPSTSAIPVNKPLKNLALVTSAATPGGVVLTVDESSDVTASGSEPSPVDEPSATLTLLTPRVRLSIVKVVSSPVTEVGDALTYAIRVTNNGGPMLPATTVNDRLPLGFSYIEGSARLTATGGTAQRLAEPVRAGALLTFALPPQPTTGEVTLTYRLRVGVGAQQGDGINRATATTDTGVASNESSARVVVRGGVFTDEACVIGRVFVDLNGNRLVDAHGAAGADGANGNEPGVPGVRVVLEDGTTITTDGAGNYSACGLRPGTHVVKIDPLTVPAGGRLVAATNRQAGDADTMFLDLRFGELRRADFILEPLTPADQTTVAALLTTIDGRRAKADRGLLPPDWSGGISGSMVAVRGANNALPGGAPAPVAGGFVASSSLGSDAAGVGRIELSVPDGPTSAEAPVRMIVKLFDADGRPVSGAVRVELAGASLAGAVVNADASEPTTANIETRVPETGTLIDVVDGSGVIEITAVDRARDVQVRATAGLATATGTLSFPTPVRPVMAVGVVEGLIALTHVRGDAMTPAQPADVFDRELREFSRALGDTGTVGARGAMYLRGTVKGDYLMTMAYDSERPDRGVLFRDIQPDAFYPVYGDASVKTFDAQTSGKFYLRVERGRSYLLYGDMLTAAPAGEARNLGTYSRTLTGVQQRIERGRAVVNLFASRDTLRQVIDEVSGRGISGPYSVSNANGVSGTEKVEIITRDRNQPAIVLSALPLTRFVDYEFEPFSGRVLFRKPVPSMDERLNPVSVRITYEVDGGGERHWVDGVDGQFGLGRRLSIGGSVAQDHNPYAPFSLASANLALHLGASTTFVLEGAQTTSTLNTTTLNRATATNLASLSGEVTGSARRAELRHESSRAQLRVYFGDSDPAFNNPSASLTGGRSEAGFRGSWRLAPSLQLRGEAIQSKDRLTGGERRGGLLSLESRFRRLTFEGGLRVINETATPASPVSGGVLEPFGTSTASGFGFGATAGSIDPVTGLPVVSAGVTPLLSAAGLVAPLGRDLDATTLRARLSAKITERVSAYGEAEQDVTDADKHMAAAGGEFRISERGRLYGRHEFISSLDGIYALNEASRAQRTVFGLSTGYMKGGDVFSEYRMRDAISGREAQAAIGLRNAWTVADGVRLSTGVERLNPLRGTSARPATAASLGLEHTRSRDLKATGRVEWRREGDANNWLSTVGLARKLSTDWTLLGKNYFQLTQPASGLHQRQNRLWFGTAYRDQAHNRLNMLSRYELRLEQLPVNGLDTVSTDRRVQIVSTHADYQPARAWNLFGQYAAKWVSEQYDNAPTRYNAHLLATRLTRDVTARVDVGGMLSLLYSPTDARTRTAVGAEVGVRLRESTWLSFGYNVTGFNDRDLRDVLKDGYTTRDAYVRLRFKFDEELFGKKGR